MIIKNSGVPDFEKKVTDWPVNKNEPEYHEPDNARA